MIFVWFSLSLSISLYLWARRMPVCRRYVRAIHKCVTLQKYAFVPWILQVVVFTFVWWRPGGVGTCSYCIVLTMTRWNRFWLCFVSISPNGQYCSSNKWVNKYHSAMHCAHRIMSMGAGECVCGCNCAWPRFIDFELVLRPSIRVTWDYVPIGLSSHCHMTPFMHDVNICEFNLALAKTHPCASRWNTNRRWIYVYMARWAISGLERRWIIRPIRLIRLGLSLLDRSSRMILYCYHLRIFIADDEEETVKKSWGVSSHHHCHRSTWNSIYISSRSRQNDFFVCAEILLSPTLWHRVVFVILFSRLFIVTSPVSFNFVRVFTVIIFYLLNSLTIQ